MNYIILQRFKFRLYYKTIFVTNLQTHTNSGGLSWKGKIYTAQYEASVVLEGLYYMRIGLIFQTSS